MPKMKIVQRGDATLVVPEDTKLLDGDVVLDNPNDTRDIWEKMYDAAKEEYHPEDISPFFQAHHVVAALESAKTGKIYTGFCIEGASGVMNLCAERVAALNMYIAEKNLIVRRMIAFRDKPPVDGGGMPCGACREYFMQAAYENRDMEIMTDYKTRKTVLLKDIIPNWWGDKRYKKN